MFLCSPPAKCLFSEPRRCSTLASNCTASKYKNVLVSEIKNIEIERLVKKKKASSKEDKRGKVRFEKIVKFISSGWMKEQLLELSAGVECWSSLLEFSAGVGSAWFGPVCWLTSSLHSSEFISSSHDTSTFHSQPDVSWENSAAQPVSGAVSGAKDHSGRKKYHHVFVQEWTDINNSVTSSTTAADKRTIRQLTHFCAIFIGVDSKQYSTETNIHYFNIICIHVLLCMWRNTKKKSI